MTPSATGDTFDIKGYQSIFLHMHSNGSIHQAMLTRGTILRASAAVYSPGVRWLTAAIVKKGTMRSNALFCEEGE